MCDPRHSRQPFSLKTRINYHITPAKITEAVRAKIDWARPRYARLLVGFGDEHGLGEAGTVGRVVGAAFGHRLAVLKGGGGEAEWTGAKPLLLTAGDAEQDWPALPDAGRPSSQTPADLAAVWHGTRDDPAAAAAIIATAAVALQAAGRLHGPASCLSEARRLWDHRR